MVETARAIALSIPSIKSVTHINSVLYAYYIPIWIMAHFVVYVVFSLTQVKKKELEIA